MDNEDYVNIVLGDLGDINDDIHSKKEFVEEFLHATRQGMKWSDCEILQRSSFLYSGSSYEKTAVEEDADFDILMVLPKPYSGVNFQPLESDTPGYYKLEWINSDDEDEPDFIGWHGILQTKNLLDFIFGELCLVLREVKRNNPEWRLSFRTQHSTVIVHLQDSDGYSLKIDIVPQIGRKDWEFLPGACRIDELPAPIQQSAASRHFQYPILWSLVPAPQMLDQDDGDCLVTTSFSLLEKRFMKDTGVVRDAVILVKMLSSSRGWKRGYGLRPFQIKRVAMKHYNELVSLSTWRAFQMLLTYLSSELRGGVIDGFLIRNQDTFLRSQSTCDKLADQINGAKTYVQPNNLGRCLDSDD